MAICARSSAFRSVSPTDLTSTVTPPAFDASKTTRQRFADHLSDPKCAACMPASTALDSRSRPSTHGRGAAGVERPATENGLPIDTSSSDGNRFRRHYADSNALTLAMSTSASARLSTRQIFRASAGRSDNSVKVSENAFVDFWKQLPDAQQGSILETLVAYVKSPNFGVRRPQ